MENKTIFFCLKMRTKITKIIAFLAMNANESLKLARFFHNSKYTLQIGSFNFLIEAFLFAKKTDFFEWLSAEKIYDF